MADGLYGNSPECLEAVERYVGRVYVVAIPADMRGWLQGPVMETTPYRYRGEVRTKRQVAAKDSEPPSVEAIAKGMPGCCWYRRTVSEGTKGPMAYACTKRRMTLCRDGLPDRAVWLVSKRSLGAEPTYWYDISNAPLRPRCPCLSGSVASGGPLSSVVRKQKPSGGWIIMKSAHTRAGTTIC